MRLRDVQLLADKFYGRLAPSVEGVCDVALPKRTGQIGRASAQAPAVAASKLECKVLSSDGHARLQSAQDMSPGVEQQDF